MTVVVVTVSPVMDVVVLPEPTVMLSLAVRVLVSTLSRPESFEDNLMSKPLPASLFTTPMLPSVKLEVSAPPLRFKVSSLPSSIFSPESLTKLRLELLISPMLVLISLMLPAS